MATSRSLRKNILKLPGFYFGPSQPYPPRHRAGKIYDTLLAGTTFEQTRDLEGAKSHITNLIHRLFETCLSNADIHTVIQGSHSFWYIIGIEWPVGLEPTEVQDIANAFIYARCQYRGNASTPLTLAVDRWATLWPNKYEAALLEDPAIQDGLVKTAPSRLPRLPSGHSLPTDVKRFLCLATLQTRKPNGDTSMGLFPAPIAFLDNNDRKPWHNATGALSKTYATVDDFITYARDCLENHGRKLVVGLFNSWSRTAEEIRGAYDTSSFSGGRDYFWAQSYPRSSMVITLQRMNENKIRLHMFDPSVSLATQPLTMQDMAWKVDIYHRMQERLCIGELWHEGRIHEAMTSFGVPWNDAVQLSCVLIWALATGLLEASQLGGF
ncbi:hypothetical protein F4819DRAFT_490801 [Hypoxylon fuscum]|nr:hypothetical protein F4819DRAFT_490801 [Hypoxylon fuscum]